MRFRLPFRRTSAATEQPGLQPLPALEALKREIESDPNFLAWRLCGDLPVAGPGANRYLCIAVYHRRDGREGRAREDHVHILVKALNDGSEVIYQVD